MLVHYFTDGTFIDFNQDTLSHFDFTHLIYNIANETRYSNQIPWSVLQHSLATGLACTRLFPGNHSLIQYGYLHDIHEAIIRDVPNPLKATVGEGWYKMERSIQDKILNYLRVGRPGDDDAEIFELVDRTMSFVEAAEFFSSEKIEYMKSIRNYDPELVFHCTRAFSETMGIEIWEGNTSDLNASIIELFKQVIYSTIL